MHIKGPQDMLSPYIPLNTSRKKILQDCANTEIKEVRTRNPCHIKESTRTCRSKLFRFHQSHGNNTKEWAHLKDTIK